MPRLFFHWQEQGGWSASPETGEAAPKRKLPKRRTPYQVCPELYALKDLLLPCNLSRSISMLGVDEYRLKKRVEQGWKKGSSRMDGFSVSLGNNPSGRGIWAWFSFGFCPFGAIKRQEFCAVIWCIYGNARTTLNILHYVSGVCRVDRIKTGYVDQVKKL